MWIIMEAKVKPQVIYSHVIIKPEKALRILGGVLLSEASLVAQQ